VKKRDTIQSREEFKKEGTKKASEPNKTIRKSIKKISRQSTPEKIFERESRFFNDFFSSSVTPLVLFDKNFNFIRVNEAYARIWQKDISYFRGKNRFELNSHKIKPIFEEVVRTKKPFKATEYPFVFDDYPEKGQTYWNWSLTPLLDKKGDVEMLVMSSEDVTERKVIEQTMKASEEHTRAVLEALPVGVWFTDENGVIIHGNGTAQKIWKGAKYVGIEGYKEYKGWWVGSGKPIKPEEWALARAIQKGEISMNEEVEIECFDGTHKIILNSALPIRDTNGKVKGAIVVNQDITQEKETARQISITNTLLKLFAEKMSLKEYLDGIVEQIKIWSGCSCVGIRVFDEEGYLPYKSCVGFGHDFLQLESQVPLEGHGCICVRVAMGINEIQDSHAMTEGGSFCCNDADEFLNMLSKEKKERYRGVCFQKGYKSVAVIPVRSNERMVGVIHIADTLNMKIPPKTITFLESISPLIGEAIFRFSVESDLRSVSAYNRSLIEVSLDPLVTIDPKGKISDVNSATEKITGYCREELIGTDFSDYFTDPERARIAYQLAFGEGSVRDYELQIRHRDKRRITPVLYNAAVYRDRAGQVKGVFAAARDITEKVRLEQEIRQAQKMQAIGTLAGGIAHDFNNIIAGIIGFTEMALDDIQPDNPTHRRLELALKGAYRGRDLVRQILTFSRRGEQEKKPVSMSSVLDGVLPLVRASLPSTIEIRKHVLVKDDNIIEADQTQLHQVILNLSANAAYAMRDKSGILELVLDEEDISFHKTGLAKRFKPGVYVKLVVCDNGCGMEPELIERIFDPFFTTKPPGEGTGLGLTIVHGIIENHNGFVRVNSKPGEGTSIYVYIPKTALGNISETNNVTDIRGGTESILVIDDEGLLIEMNIQRLERLGYKATGVVNALEAFELFNKDPYAFDLVIADYTMPNMTGLELAGKLLSIRPDISIILCSGLNESVPLEKIKETGIKEFFAKPINKTEFAQLIRRVLDNKV